jgi:glucose-1-phosphate cytidylyltransferase
MRTRPTKVIKRVREKHILRVVILAGDRGSRLSEETDVKPKPMVEIGGKPFLWHIMKHYAHCGFEEFFIALGYKGEMVKPYFLDYHSLQGSMSIDLSKGEVRTHKKDHEEWLVHLFDTGIDTNTGGRIKRLQPWLEDETFMVERIERISRDVLD